MTLRDALGSPQVRALVAAIVGQELNAGFGGAICEAPAELPTAPVGDRSLVGALLSPAVVSMIRDMAREQVAERKRAMKEVIVMEEHRAGPERPSLAVLEAGRQVAGRLRPRRFSRASIEFMERRESDDTAAVLKAPAGGSAAPVPSPALAAYLARREASLARVGPSPVTDGDRRVVDPHNGGIVEAAVAAVPPAERGWREMLARRGFSAEMIERMERCEGDAA